MGKGLKCADCGREFRGERRRRCSDTIQSHLRQKHMNTFASAEDFVHEACSVLLRKKFGALNGTQPEVSTSRFSLIS